MASIWDAELKDTQEESREYPTLPEGTYEFEVMNVTGKEYQPKPGSKIGRCAEIDIQMRVEGNGQEVTVFDRLYSDPRTVWKMTAFAKCVGIFSDGMTPGQLLRKANGTIGKAHFTLRPATNEYAARNEVKAYIAQEPKKVESDELPF